MRSVTERNPNPKSVSLSKFLAVRARPVSRGYVGLRNGQIIREDTLQRWQAEGRIR